MRTFPVYAPKLIVKHVRIFLKGAIWVADLGRLEFDNGKFVLPRSSLPKVKQAILELNGLLTTQTHQTKTV
ncbi:DUF1107 domain-containing protein [Shewanella sp. AS16]|uniref:DUF1107 domain-containing protein n=1 Tax=Shewanella sp. AS16 TaxID=2907625 RepID=UPI001F20E3CB|nr:DUF1107 domain-containing protein [Shewanella sp. AS16]MCE9686009.1 DUF1107 domain-containing protein [Shewanella sp. AS16]